MERLAEEEAKDARIGGLSDRDAGHRIVCAQVTRGDNACVWCREGGHLHSICVLVAAVYSGMYSLLLHGLWFGLLGCGFCGAWLCLVTGFALVLCCVYTRGLAQLHQCGSWRSTW